MKKKDNFDLRKYLIENKMTENSRGNVRRHFTAKMSRKGGKLLIEGEDPELNEWFGPGFALDPENRDELDIVMKADGSDYDYYDDEERDLEECGDNLVLGGDLEEGDRKERWAKMFDAEGWNDDEEEDEAYYEPNEDLFSEAKSGKKEKSAKSFEKLDEAEEEDWEDPDILGDPEGMNLSDLIGKDKGARRAKLAAQRDLAADSGDEEPADFGDDDLDGEDDEETMDDVEPMEFNDNAPIQHGLADQIKYDPNLVKIHMSPDELDKYLSSFRRPQVAVAVLNRMLRVTQKQVNEDIGIDYTHILLGGGFYHTSQFKNRYKETAEWNYGSRGKWVPGELIATVRADKAWRDKEFND